MAKIRLRYVHEFVDGTGTVRRYFRREGKRTPLPGRPGSREFMEEYQRLLASAPETPKGSAAKPRSLAALIDRYYRTATWKQLRATTQRVERRTMERLRAEYGERPADTMPRAAISAVLDKVATTPGTANSFRAALKKLMDLAVQEEWREDNPVERVRKVKYAKAPHLTWEEEHIAAFEAAHPPGSRARLAFALLLYTAQRRSDVVRMGWQHVDNGVLYVKQQKTRAEVRVPMHPDLVAELARLPKTQLTFLVTQFGAPFTVNGFSNWFRECCDKAGLPALAAHGLRKGASRRLAEAGCSGHEIKAITGHATLAMVDLYTVKADQKRLAGSAMEKLSRPRMPRIGDGE